MARFKLTRLAEADLESILSYTSMTWGIKQAERYLDDFQSHFNELAEFPGLGRSCERLLPGLMRMEHGRHVVFYRLRPYGIRIIRILHQNMLPDSNLLNG